MQSKETPISQGYIFPAEWEKHIATWLTYPLPNESWPDNFDAVASDYNQFIRIISESEKVKIITLDHVHSDKIRNNLAKLDMDINQVSFYPFGTNDSWCRDHGPAFLKNPTTGKKAIVKWEFNAWGGKYPYDLDNETGNKITEIFDLPIFKPGIVMEGGSVEVNGIDTLMTTKSCLLNKNRNPHLTQKEIEAYLSAYYGYRHIIWLEDGVEGDDTDGHIDDIARFVNEDTVIIAVEKDKNDKNHSILKNNLEILKRSRTASNKPLNLIELPMPEPMYVENTRLPCSYANFFITNKHVIVPVFGTKKDDKALEILQECFSDRVVTGISSRNIIFGLGSWHCLSQQEVE